LNITCLVPYLFSFLSELILYIRKEKEFSRKKFTGALCISIPAFSYSIWAITGQENEVLIWGYILLAAGIPVHIYL